MRRRAAAALLALLVVIVAHEPLRSWLFDVTPLPARHAAVAAWTALLPEGDETADMVPVAHTGGNPYGINVFLEQEVEEAKVRRSLEMIREAGFGWIKQQVVWGEVELPAKGEFVDRATGGERWRKYDRIVDLASESGRGRDQRRDGADDRVQRARHQRAPVSSGDVRRRRDRQLRHSRRQRIRPALRPGRSPAGARPRRQLLAAGPGAAADGAQRRRG